MNIILEIKNRICWCWTPVLQIQNVLDSKVHLIKYLSAGWPNFVRQFSLTEMNTVGSFTSLISETQTLTIDRVYL